MIKLFFLYENNTSVVYTEKMLINIYYILVLSCIGLVRVNRESRRYVCMYLKK